MGNKWDVIEKVTFYKRINSTACEWHVTADTYLLSGSVPPDREMLLVDAVEGQANYTRGVQEWRPLLDDHSNHS